MLDSRWKRRSVGLHICSCRSHFAVNLLSDKSDSDHQPHDPWGVTAWPMPRTIFQTSVTPVAKLCARFPGEYWRKLDREMAYPREFVEALTEAGWLSVLIPEEYGGVGLPLSAAAAILEEMQKAGCNAGACHAQMYTHGHSAPSWFGSTEAAVSAGHCLREVAPSGIRRDRTDQWDRYRRTQDQSHARRRSLCGQRTEDLDQPCRAFRPHAAACAHHTASRRNETHRRPVGSSGRHARGQGKWSGDTPDPHNDEPRHDGSVLRQPARAGREPDRRGRPGLSLHSLRHERGTHPDCR